MVADYPRYYDHRTPSPYSDIALAKSLSSGQALHIFRFQIINIEITYHHGQRPETHSQGRCPPSPPS
jgi:hypothetical protein